MNTYTTPPSRSHCRGNCRTVLDKRSKELESNILYEASLAFPRLCLSTRQMAAVIIGILIPLLFFFKYAVRE